jgi:MoxR-like ATPase
VTPIQQIQEKHGIVGRERELAMALAVLGAGRHLLLEGPVGVGKTTVALAVCGHLGRATLRVDGDDRYSESKLTGWFDPPLVLKAGYGESSFFAGPLVEAMRRGAVLFINELNRMPETVQNVLLPALDERLIQVPHIGEVRAAAGFQVVATQNPVEYVATGHLSEALRDRFEHLALPYQPAEEEAAIVAAETGSPDAALIATAVRLTRATRRHPRFRKGASVRAAIATVAIAERLHAGCEGCGGVERETLRRAAAAALATRVDLRDDIDADFAGALDELLELVVDRGEDPDVALAAEEAGPKA